MAQSEIQVTTTPPLPGTQLVQEINDALETIATDFSGAIDPAANAFAYSLWADTGTGDLKRRNAANSAWTTIGRIYPAIVENSSGELVNPAYTGTLTGGTGVINIGSGQLYKDASGNVGIGTDSPAYKLDVNDSFRINASANANDASFYLRSGSTSGTLQQILFQMAGSSGDVRIVGSNQNNVLWFTTNGEERMRIDSSGNLLVGATSATAGSGTGFKVIAGGDAADRVQVGSSFSTNSGIGYSMYSTTAGSYRFYVGYGGTIYATSTTISAISDQRYKENIRDLDVGLNAVLSLKPRVFDWKKGKGKDIKNDRGFIAQEFEKVFPDLIDEWLDPSPKGEEPYKSVRQDLIPVLVKAIQELKAEFDAYKAAHP